MLAWIKASKGAILAQPWYARTCGLLSAQRWKLMGIRLGAHEHSLWQTPSDSQRWNPYFVFSRTTWSRTPVRCNALKTFNSSKLPTADTLTAITSLAIVASAMPCSDWGKALQVLHCFWCANFLVLMSIAGVARCRQWDAFEPVHKIVGAAKQGFLHGFSQSPTRPVEIPGTVNELLWI